jgi:hypothetical protein
MRRAFTRCLGLSALVIPSACSALPAPAPTPEPTARPVPTQSPTTAPPTQQVVDPLAGPKPEGEGITLDPTRHLWTRTSSGSTQYYSQEIGDWTVAHILQGNSLHGGIPLHLQSHDPYGFPDSVPLYYDVQVGLVAPSIQNRDNPSDYSGDWKQQLLALTGSFMNWSDKYYYRNVMHYSKPYSEEPKSLMALSGDPSVPPFIISFKMPWEESREVTLGKSTGERVELVSWDHPIWQQVDSGKKPKYWETTNWYGPNQPAKEFIQTRWTLTEDPQGNLVVIAAVQHPELLSGDQLHAIMLGPLGTLLQSTGGEQLPATIPWWDARIWLKLVDNAGRDYWPGSETGPALEYVPVPGVTPFPTPGPG